jgi:parvulin-like peptidyl-prolyl isomerase
MLGYLRSGSKRTKMIWWAVTIATVFTFLIGFSFFGSLGRDPSAAARQSGSFGSVNGERITREMWTNALDAERAAFRQRFGTDPVDRDLKQVEQQAWRKLVNSRLLAQAATSDGIKVTDNDVIFGMQATPPAILQSSPSFQTDGKFDPNKYHQALLNPGNDWGPFEQQVRQDAPMSKLQERLIASIKLPEGELRESIRDRFERLTAVVLQVPPADSGTANASDAELQKVFEKYRGLMASPSRTQLEMLSIPLTFAPEEVKTAMDLANSLVQRAQRGEDFAQLARDYSEGANADNGGIVDRFMTANDLGPVGKLIESRRPGDVVGPFHEASSVMLFRILDPARDSVARNGPVGSFKLAQITIKVHGNPEALRTQFEAATKLAQHAKAVGLGRAATEKGLATSKTPFYDLDNVPPQLYTAPDLADWGIFHKKGEVSPVFQTPDELLIAQVALQHDAGPVTREEVADQLKAIADAEHRVDLAKPRADKIAAAIQSGTSIEDAAKAAGLTANAVTLTRAQPDQRLAVATELQGKLWAAQQGQVVGPVRTPAGWFFGRKIGVLAVPDSLWANESLKDQLRTQMVSQRQRNFFSGYLYSLRRNAKVVDARN